MPYPTLNDIRNEIADTYGHGIPKAEVVRGFKAKLWPVLFGWDYVVDDSLDHEKELNRLIQLGIAETDDDGEDPEKSIGRLIVELAMKRVTSEYNDIIEELEPGDPDYGYDSPDTVRVNLDRSAA